MEILANTPFNEYREEQSSNKLTDYFVKPGLFSRITDNKPKLLYGSRGTGKTTILKALSLEQAEDKEAYIKQNNYIGIYYRADLNISTAFYDNAVEETTWYKLFSYYLSCTLTLELFQQLNAIKDFFEVDEKVICEEVSMFFAVSEVYTAFQDLIFKIKKEIKGIESFINNMPSLSCPYIGSYESILREIPRIIFERSNSEFMKDKHVIYLIDEFENFEEYQQKSVFTFLKYANQNQTYIIGLRPLGLKTLSTNGNEYIRETDDYVTEVLDDQVDYEDFARDVCNKRIELFYKKYFPEIVIVPSISDFFELKQQKNEINLLFEDDTVQQKHIQRVKVFLDAFRISDTQYFEYLTTNQGIFYLLLTRLIKLHNRKQEITKEFIINELRLFQEPDDSHKNFIQNYQTAMLYYLVHLYSKQKDYSGFSTLIALSGHTLRYLLEICDEIFMRVYSEDKTLYTSPKQIPQGIQTSEVIRVSQRRLDQMKTVPGIGPTMRQFINTLGFLSTVQTEDTGMAKWEVNHFSIKPDKVQHQDITDFLNECVFRGILIQLDNNKIKVKNTINYDQSMYQMHPIYTPKFQVSWRKKQKFDFSISEISVMIGSDTNKINSLIKNYKENTISGKIEDIIKYLKNQDAQSSIFD